MAEMIVVAEAVAAWTETVAVAEMAFYFVEWTVPVVAEAGRPDLAWIVSEAVSALDSKIKLIIKQRKIN